MFNDKEKSYTIENIDGVKFTHDASHPVLSERVRPRKLFDLVLPKEIEKQLGKIIKEKKCPNLLLYSLTGGTGKDSIVSVISDELNLAITKFDVSKGGIGALRDAINNFVQLPMTFTGQRRAFYIAESGELTTKQLDSLKSFIEEHSKEFTFIMTTNSIQNLSEPMAQRFEMIDLNIIPADEKNQIAKRFFERINAVLKFEGIAADPKDVKEYLITGFPSFRKIWHLIEQSTYNGKLTPSKDSDPKTEAILNWTIAVNNGDYNAIVKIAKQIDPMMVCRFISKYIGDLLEDMALLPTFIIDFEDFNRTISTNGSAMPHFSLMAFSTKLIKNNIKFKIV